MKKLLKRLGHWLFTGAVSLLCLALTLGILQSLVYTQGTGPQAQGNARVDAGILDRQEMLLAGELSAALEGVVSIEKKYWLRDQDLIAPEPDPSCYGTTDDPAQLAALIEKAAPLLQGQSLLFTPDGKRMPGSQVQYYLDDTILVITWKQVIRDVVFTMSEVKIAHPSQLRRFLAGGQYGSDKQYTTTEMAAAVNAVVASSGDFYGFRQAGVRVYEGKVYRVGGRIDSCMVDENGDLHLISGGTFDTVEQAQKYADENHIRFSLTFGPNLIVNGKRCEPEDYPLGEVQGYYSRAAFCQMDQLHYLMVVVGEENGYARRQQLHVFVDYLEQFGCREAYALDGGQTAAIAMNDRLVSSPDYGVQRRISDIIYFATALPETGRD